MTTLNPTLCEVADLIIESERDADLTRRGRALPDESLIIGLGFPSANEVTRVIAVYRLVREVLRRTGRLDCNVPVDAFAPLPDELFDGHPTGVATIVIAE